MDIVREERNETRSRQRKEGKEKGARQLSLFVLCFVRLLVVVAATALVDAVSASPPKVKTSTIVWSLNFASKL